MFFAIRQQRYRSSSAAVGVRFIAPAYIYSPRIRNSFRIHSRNVRNVFVICTLHIRHVKVWFLRCKSMVFGVQKGGFCIAKVWFLFFECCVVAICLECYHNPFVMFWQSVSNILAIRQQHYRNPLAAVGSDLSCPHIRKHPQNDERKCACDEMNIHI